MFVFENDVYIARLPDFSGGMDGYVVDAQAVLYKWMV